MLFRIHQFIFKTILGVLAVFCYLIDKSDAQELKIEGYYFGKNLVVMNPGNEKEGFCVKDVKANGVSLNDDITSSAFELNLNAVGVELGAPLSITIMHQSGCYPKIVNPAVIELPIYVEYVSQQYNQKEQQISWEIKGNPGNNSFVVEQFRWNRWMPVYEIAINDSLKNKTQYSFSPYLHSGNNLYRIAFINAAVENPTYSRDIRFMSKVPEIFLSYDKNKQEIKFSGQTLYEIYDEKGIMISTGFDIALNISSLAKGKYWINFDNKTEEFIKK